MVLGGSKVSDKLGVITNLIPRVDRLVIGGGMAFTFLAALGREVGASLLEADRLDDVRGLLDQAAARGVEVLLPTDVVVADTFAADAVPSVVAADAIPADQRGLDIGPATREQFAAAIESSATVFWNGPMGVFEFPAFAAGTQRVAEALTARRRVDGGRRGRLGGGGAPAGLPRRRVRAHLDRGRRVAGVPGGQDPPWPGSPGGLIAWLRSARRSWRATGR